MLPYVQANKDLKSVLKSNSSSSSTSGNYTRTNNNDDNNNNNNTPDNNSSSVGTFNLSPTSKRQLRKMFNEELRGILEIEDNFVFDCIIERAPKIKELIHERDKLKEHISNLANFNYAREPEFVRDRLKLRNMIHDTSQMIRQLSYRRLEPAVHKLSLVAKKLEEQAKKFEEESEFKAHEFLSGYSGNGSGIGSGAGASTAATVAVQDEETVAEFSNGFVKIRKMASKERILADGLAKECAALLSFVARAEKRAK